MSNVSALKGRLAQAEANLSKIDVKRDGTNAFQSAVKARDAIAKEYNIARGEAEGDPNKYWVGR